MYKTFKKLSQHLLVFLLLVLGISSPDGGTKFALGNPKLEIVQRRGRLTFCVTV